ncbi:MAG: hypothetical protein JWL85_5 [Candidatus Saccharibacteria bacterium]|nr:hypothetical protein [Candidatus Saccharibacteria bacterium]
MIKQKGAEYPARDDPIDVEEKPAEEITGTSERELDTSDEPKTNKLVWLKNYYMSHKKLAIPATVLVMLLIIFAAPFTRYPVLGLVMKQQVAVQVIDARSGKPVSETEVEIAGQNSRTDANGWTNFSAVPVGNKTVVATKKYYKDAQIKVPVPLTKKAEVKIRIEATGRQVPVVIKNKISGVGVKGATVKVLDTETKTDDKGEAIIVLPPNKETEEALISIAGFNELKTTIKVTEAQTLENTYAITPAGKIYFLSKKSGKLDVVKTNLDGSDRQTVLAGTGREEDQDTTLLASRDWKYMALKSRREGDNAKLYMIETANDKLTTMDEGDAGFSLVGWSNNYFTFLVIRNNVKNWESKRQSLKSFNAESKQLKTLDSSVGEGSHEYDQTQQSISNLYKLKNEIVYTKTWSTNNYTPFLLNSKKSTLESTKPDGSGRRVIRSFDMSPGIAYQNIAARLYTPNEVYLAVGGPSKYYEYINGEVKDATDAKDQFDKYYPTYLISPSDNASFWYKPRDGKNTLFTGNADGNDAKKVSELSEFTPYGWYSDGYLLVSKKGSELYIMPKKDSLEEKDAFKITDYHRSNQSYQGYGYGYGGL